VTLPLHGAPNPRMYGVLTANTPGCVAFSFPVQRWNLKISGVPAFSVPPLRAKRDLARPAGRVGSKPERRPVPGTSVPGTVLRSNHPDIGPPRGPAGDFRRALRAPTPWLSATINKGGTCRQHVPDGPTLDAPDCVTDQPQRKIRRQAERQLRPAARSARIRVGAAHAVAIWPSPHPRIRWTVASPDSASCAHGPTRPPPPRVTKCPTRC
jgi:hypothetical protein